MLRGKKVVKVELLTNAKGSHVEIRTVNSRIGSKETKINTYMHAE